MKHTEVFEEKNLIIGVGLMESLISAAMATDHNLSINLEASHNYSGTFMTLGIREIERLFSEKKDYKGKEEIQRDIKIEFLEEGTETMEQFIEKYGFRGFCFDFNPRIIYSAGKATDMMVEAQIDNYLSFRTIKGLYLIDNLEKGSMEIVPTDKGGIFKNKLFSLKEKKELFDFLNIAMRFYRKVANVEEEHNSINDFKKNVYTEIHSQLSQVDMKPEDLDEHFVKFVRASGVTSDRMIQVISSCLCNFRINPFKYVRNGFEDQSTRAMLQRLTRFIESMNVHSELPYLYPIYGTGDITQIFSRISAVYGGAFLLGTEFEIQSVDFTQESKYSIKVQLPTGVSEVKVENVYIGPEYRSLVAKFPCEKKAEVALLKSQYEMRYVGYVCHLQRSAKADEKAPSDFPLMCYFELQAQERVASPHPISSLVVDSTCGTCPEHHVIVYFNYLVEDETRVDEKYLLERYLELLCSRLESVAKIRPIFKIAHNQQYRIDQFTHLGQGLTLLPDIDFDADMETCFVKAKQEIRKDESLKLFNRTQEECVDRLAEDELDDEDSNLLDELDKFTI